MLSISLGTALVMTFLLKCSLCYVHHTLQCPPTHILEPCECQKECFTCKARVVCEGIEIQEVLDGVLERSRYWGIGNFEINGANIISIPTSIFKIPHLSSLEITHSSLISLFDHIPPRDNVLEDLTLDNVQFVAGLQWPQLAPLNLETLTIHLVRVPKIDDSFTLFIPQSIISLTIDNCLTSELSDHAFASMEDLQTLTFSNNNVKILKRSMFPEPAKLTKLSFRSNKIEVLPHDLLTDMPDLREIVFADNVISTLSEEMFLPVINQLTVIDFSDNPLYCGCNMRWVVEEKYNMDMTGTCVAPKEVERFQLSELLSHDFWYCDRTVKPVHISEPQEESTPEVTEPQQESTPEVTQPQQESRPEVTEPQQESSPEVTEPQQESTPEVTEPQPESTPEVTEPQEESSPEVTEPRKETTLVVTSPPEKVYIPVTKASKPSGPFHFKVPFFEVGF